MQATDRRPITAEEAGGGSVRAWSGGPAKDAYGRMLWRSLGPGQGLAEDRYQLNVCAGGADSHGFLFAGLREGAATQRGAGSEAVGCEGGWKTCSEWCEDGDDNDDDAWSSARIRAPASYQAHLDGRGDYKSTLFRAAGSVETTRGAYAEAVGVNNPKVRPVSLVVERGDRWWWW